MPNPKDPKKLEEYKKKMSEIAKAKGYGKWMKGKKHSPEVIEKMRQTQTTIGNTLEEKKARSERAKELGYGKWMSGRKLPESVVNKMTTYSKMARLLQKDTGKTQIENLMRKMSNRKHFVNNPRSLDPDAREKHGSNWQYREWRDAVYKRDNYTCCLCKKRGGDLNAHHIYEWAKFKELRFVVSNGMTLCEYTCHSIVAKMERREAFQVAGVTDPTEYE